ncbi:hypothetical protein ACFQHW_02615 [Lapidilactobacillus achengensis]|uniref:Integral membrane protein n=1 Tax=Lapidilactobacillus achengensis TaxID=2486000 RepID=A0ABW1UNW4_9LACO|nr:hypothetical protein [Lapidilactobacillus achengensis]
MLLVALQFAKVIIALAALISSIVFLTKRYLNASIFAGCLALISSSLFFIQDIYPVISEVSYHDTFETKMLVLIIVSVLLWLASAITLIVDLSKLSFLRKQI